MYSFLKVLSCDYGASAMNFIKNENTEEEKEFYSKYINPVLEKNNCAEIECDFNSAISAAQRKGFTDGFRACIRFMAECMTQQKQNT